MQRVALYVRVSTADQDLAGQERELRDYAARRGWSVTVAFVEKASASGRVEREVWNGLQREACLRGARRFDRVLVWAIDRWSREASFVRAVGSIEELEALGVRWHSLKEPMLDSGEDGAPNLARDILRGILPVISAFEARRRSDRTQLAMREIKEGRRAPRGPVGRPRRLTPELEARVVSLREQGLPYRAIAQRVGLPLGTCRYAVYRSKRGQPRV